MPFFCIHCRSRIDSTFKACPHCGEPITDFLRRHLDEPIDGKYQILTRLAVGGMGEVYKALHVHLNALRVIKLLRPKVAGDRVANERFMREARLATKISHPNVATLYDFATLEDGSQYMVWEYIEGINLHEMIEAHGPPGPRQAAELAVQALTGLDAIHRAGIIHRDISPENLMISHDDEGRERVRIIDLGIAKAAVSDESPTQAGMFVGKWKYCSPEHLGMLPPGEKIDARADLYSFGVVLYEMLAGVPPFRADSPHEYVILHSSKQPPPLRDANPGLPELPELEAIVLRALHKDREQRFGSAREFAAAIEAIAPSLPEGERIRREPAQRAEVTEPDAEASVPGQRSPRSEPAPARMIQAADAGGRRRLLRAAGAGLVLVLLLFLGWRSWNRSQILPADPPPRRNALAAAPRPLAGHVGINVYPWAQVIRIRSEDSGKIITPGPGAITPMSVALEPGAWEITLTNPRFQEPLNVGVLVVAGSEQIVNANFEDPHFATMPDFGGAQ